jgi:hypothetical protein
LILTVRSTINNQDWKLCENNVKKHNNKPASGFDTHKTLVIYRERDTHTHNDTTQHHIINILRI